MSGGAAIDSGARGDHSPLLYCSTPFLPPPPPRTAPVLRQKVRQQAGGLLSASTIFSPGARDNRLRCECVRVNAVSE